MATKTNDLLAHATRFTFNRLHVEQRRPGEWWITSLSEVYNHHTGDWDTEYGARHATDRAAYFTGRDEAISTAQQLTR